MLVYDQLTSLVIIFIRGGVPIHLLPVFIFIAGAGF